MGGPDLTGRKMQFWDLNKMARRLAAGEIGEWEKAKYYLAATLLGIFLGEFWLSVGATSALLKSPPMLKLLNLGLEVLINIIGFRWLYRRHGLGARPGFVERLVCFTLPSSIRMLVFGWCGGAGLLALILLAPSMRGSGALESLGYYGQFAMPVIGVLWFNFLYFAFVHRGFVHYANHCKP